MLRLWKTEKETRAGLEVSRDVQSKKSLCLLYKAKTGYWISDLRFPWFSS